MRCILFILLFALLALAAPDTYYATPGISMSTPAPASTKLRLDRLYMNMDIVASTFNMNASVYASLSGGQQGFLPVVTVAGGLFFAAPQLITFTFDNITGCSQSATGRFVNLCPFMDEIMSGPWVFAFEPTSGATQQLTIESSQQRQDPSTGKLANFLGATSPFALTCLSVPCASLSTVVPSLPSNPSFTVRYRSEEE